MILNFSTHILMIIIHGFNFYLAALINRNIFFSLLLETILYFTVFLFHSFKYFGKMNQGTVTISRMNVDSAQQRVSY